MATKTGEKESASGDFAVPNLKLLVKSAYVHVMSHLPSKLFCGLRYVKHTLSSDKQEAVRWIYR